MSIRCVVTGNDDAGKSVVVSDSRQDPLAPALLASGTEIYRMWGGDTTPTLPTDGSPPAQGPFFPDPGGYRFLFATMGPASAPRTEINDVEAARAEYEAAFPGMMEVTGRNEGGMHTTDTIDFQIILSGEVWLELDDGVEVLMRAGDCAVQNGTRHAWRNKSSEPCHMFCAMVGATRG